MEPSTFETMQLSTSTVDT